MATGVNDPYPVLRSGRHLYRLEFFADENGDGMIVELLSTDLTEALRLIKQDRPRRVVDVWEDGALLCRVSHGPRGLNVTNRPVSGDVSHLFRPPVNNLGENSGTRLTRTPN